MAGRDAHAHQFKRMRWALAVLRARLGRVIHDITRKIAAGPARQARFRQNRLIGHHSGLFTDDRLRSQQTAKNKAQID